MILGYEQARPRYASTVASHYGGARDSYVDNGYGQLGGSPRNRYNPRQQSDPTLARYANQNVDSYAGNGLQQSRDTVETGTTSGSGSEQWTNNTDPSSENSSIDPVRAIGGRPEGYEPQHGYPEYPIGYNNPQYGGPVREDSGPNRNSYVQGPNGANGYSPQHAGGALPPAAPLKMESVPRRLISLNSNGNGDPVQAPNGSTARPPLQSQPSQKRKSWLRRTFGGKE